MRAKLVWKVAEAPTGYYRSFQPRGWPTLTYGKDGPPAAWLSCESAYCGGRARGELPHQPIYIRFAHHQHPDAGNSWKVMVLKEPSTTLADAKQRVEAFLRKHPEYAPKELQST